MMSGLKNIVKSLQSGDFRVFDEDKSGTLDFMEFTMAINCTNLTQPEDKLRFG